MKKQSPYKAKPGQTTCNSCKMYDECVASMGGDDLHYNGCRCCKSYRSINEPEGGVKPVWIRENIQKDKNQE